MSKVALCVTANQIDAKIPLPYWETTLQPRSVVDDPDNVDPSVLQLLPYVVIVKRVPILALVDT